MTSSIAASPNVHSFDQPICFPVKFVLSPFLWTLHKIYSLIQMVIGYFVTIGVFSFGAWNKSWFKRKIIEMYKGEIFCLNRATSFDPNRLEQGFAVLNSLGGIRTSTYSKDGTKLDSMLLRYKDVKKTIEKRGGQLIKSFPVSDFEKGKDGDGLFVNCRENRSGPKEYVDVILPKNVGPQWNVFCEKTLKNLGLKRTKVQLKNGKIATGFILNHWNEKNPTRPKEGQLFLRFNSPTESFVMAKRDIMRRLFLGQDVLCFDPPGTWKSEGIPKEERYYAAAETMVEKAVYQYGYRWRDIWLDGFCLGGAIAIHLKRKFHDKGINLFVQNTFNRMKDTLKSQIFPANYLAPLGLEEVKSRDPAIQSLVEKTADGFDSVKKLTSLIGKSKMGHSIIVNVKNDGIIDEESHFELASTADKVSKTTSILLDDPNMSHRSDILSDRDTWKKVVTSITAKDYPWVLENRAKWWLW